MTANLAVKIGIAVLVLVAGALAGTRILRGGEATVVPVGEPSSAAADALSPETAAAIGIEADTPADTLRTVLGRFEETSARLGAIEDTNSALRAENEDLRTMRESIVDEVGASLRDDLDGLRGDLETLVAAARVAVEGGRGGAPGGPDLGGGPGIGGTGAGGAAPAGRPADLVWIRPLGDQAAGVAGLAPWTDGGGAFPAEPGGEEGPPPPRPVYTVPRNSTLVGARAFTALVGRVPVGEEARVVDPYFFKVLVGRDNLAANGHEMPGLAYAVASGRSIGDWTLGCVSGEVTSMTFVFADGRIATVPPAEDVSAGGGGGSRVRLGSLSDDYGNPCVPGRRVTNAGPYLLQSVGALTLGAAAEGAAAAQTATVAGSGVAGAVTVVDGDVGGYAAGRGLSGAAEEVARWVARRQAREYDAVYVPPGARVGVHVEEELRIDYDPGGRMVDHEGGGGVRHRALD